MDLENCPLTEILEEEENLQFRESLKSRIEQLILDFQRKAERKKIEEWTDFWSMCISDLRQKASDRNNADTRKMKKEEERAISYKMDKSIRIIKNTLSRKPLDLQVVFNINHELGWEIIHPKEKSKPVVHTIPEADNNKSFHRAVCLFLLYSEMKQAKWVRIDLDCIQKSLPVPPHQNDIISIHNNQFISPIPQNQVTNFEPVAVHGLQFPDPNHNFLPTSGCVCINSKMYIIGGCHVDDIKYPVYNTQVSIFDLSTNIWEESKMQFPRGSPTIVAVGNIIYVFGGKPSVLEDGFYVEKQIPKEQWAESYDTQYKKLEFLPSPPQPVADSIITLHAVYERRNQILFWMHKVGVYSYNYVTKTWSDPLEYSCLHDIETLICFRVAVVDDVLFWHYCGVIHAFDLFNKRHLFSQSLDKSLTSFGEELQGYTPDRNYLLRVGENTLLLLFWDFFNVPGRRFQCHRFQIIKSTNAHLQGGGEDVFYLQPDGCGIFDLTSGQSVTPIDVVVA